MASITCELVRAEPCAAVEPLVDDDAGVFAPASVRHMDTAYCGRAGGSVPTHRLLGSADIWSGGEGNPAGGAVAGVVRIAQITLGAKPGEP